LLAAPPLLGDRLAAITFSSLVAGLPGASGNFRGKPDQLAGS
jgi:hypothetical protein